MVVDGCRLVRGTVLVKRNCKRHRYKYNFEIEVDSMKYTTFKLGEIFIKSGAMTEEALDRALKEQKGSGKRIGEILIAEDTLPKKIL